MTTVRVFTPEWASAFREAINTSREEREAVRGWVWPLALVLDRAPELGYPDDVAVLLELVRGECRTARIILADEVRAPFVVRGTHDVWRRVLHRELDPIAAVIHKELRLEGPLATLMLNTRAARALVSCAAGVPTEFPPAGRDGRG